MADENGKDLVDKGNELVGDAADAAKDVAGGAVDTAGDAADAVKDVAGGAVDKAGDAADAVKDVAGGAIDKAGDAADAVKDVAGGAIDKAGDAADAVKDVAGGAVDKAGDAADAVKDVAGGAVDKAGDAADAVKDVAGGAADAVKDVAGGAVDKAGDAVDAVKDVAGGAVDKGKELAGDAAGAVSGAAGAVAGTAGDAAEAVGDAAGAAVDKGKEVAGAAAGAVTGAAGAAADKVGGALDSVSDVFDGDGDSSSVLKWLLPLLLLGLLLVLGFMYCSPKDGGTGATNTSTEANTGNATGEATESSVSVEAKDGKYSISGVVKDDATKENIKKEAETVWGAGNVNVDGLKVNANAKDFKEGWWDGFKSLLPDLKDWKNGTIGWAAGAIKTAGDIPGAVGDKIKSLFGGWGLPVSIVGAADLAKAANEKAMELLAGADSVEKVVEGLNASIINFDSGKSDVPESAKGVLEKAAEKLKTQEEGTQVEIGGHTDNTGNADANLKLSQTRAESVRKVLIDLGVSEKMLIAKGYGQTVAKGDNETEDGRFQNRRIEYKVGGSSDASSSDDADKPKAEPASE